MQRGETMLLESNALAVFHEKATFCGLWLLVGLVGVHTMGSLRSILEPLIWAFFLMMALLPLTDLVECLLLRAVAVLPTFIPGCAPAAQEWRAEAEELERQYSGIPGGRRGSGTFMDRVEAEASGSEGSSAERTEEEKGCGFLRMVAVLFTIVVFIGGATLFVRMIYSSASHMRSVWHHYDEGARRLLDRLAALKDQVPAEVFDKVAAKTLESMGEVLNFILSALFEHVTSAIVELLMTLLYMIFWLCQPVFVGETVTGLFKRYILLKTIASAVYALCIYLLLAALGVDLAIVFGLITFLFNFVPEVGTIAAMLLPVPVILFDGRLERPFLNLAGALCGQFFLKFIFANVVEVMLVGRQHDFKMHPVTILFFVAFFGGIWGATGMLVSVPVMAAVKAAVLVIPSTYRDPILVFLEGDKDAPKRYHNVASPRL